MVDRTGGKFKAGRGAITDRRGWRGALPKLADRAKDPDAGVGNSLFYAATNTAELCIN